MTTKSSNYSLLQGFVGLFRLPWLWVTAIVAGALLILLFVVANARGHFSRGIDWSFWRLGLNSAIIVYIFAISPVTQRFLERAIAALRPLLPQPELADRIATYNRRGEWTALSVAVVFALVMVQPWRSIEQWSDLYERILSIIMFALLGLVVYGGLAGTTGLARLSRSHLRVDVFDNESLIPVARWALSMSLAFVGGTSLSVVFQPIENLRNLFSVIVYSILIIVTVLIFFTTTWSIHGAMASARRRELAMVRKNLSDARRQLKQHAAQGTPDATDRLYSAVAVWGIYERQVLEASTWPFNAGIVRRLVASTVAPAVIYLIKLLSGAGLRF